MKFLILLFLFFACSKEEPKFTHLQMYSMGKKVEQSMELMVPSGIDKRLIDCQVYIPPCKSAYKVKVKLLKFNALLYASEADAKKSAKSMNGYYSRNWAFDLVKGEPILERFIKKAFNAKRP